MRSFLTVFPFVFALAACSGGEEKESRAAIEARLNNIEEIEGTISDEMIATESSTIEAPTEGGGTTSATYNQKDSKQAGSDDGVNAASASNPGAAEGDGAVSPPAAGERQNASVQPGTDTNNGQ